MRLDLNTDTACATAGGARGFAPKDLDDPVGPAHDTRSDEDARSPDRATCDVASCVRAAAWETGGGAQAMARFCDEHRTQADAQPENAGTVWVRVDAESRQDRALCSRRRFHSDRCTRPAVAIANSIGACEEHMAKYEEIAGEVGGEPVSWKRIDGQVVALVLLVLAFFYLPGCGPAIASVQANQDRANIAASSARAAWHEDGWFAVGGGYARNSAAGCVFVSMDDKDGHWTSLFVPRDGAK